MTRSLLNKQLYILIFLFISFSGINHVFSQECPFGIENCRGGCGRWIDTDGDGVCDRSSNLHIIPDTVAVKKDTVSITNTIEAVEQNQGISGVQNKGKELQQSDHPNEAEISEYDISEQTDTETTDPEIKTTKSPPRYRMIFYSSLTIGAYLLSLLLMKLKVYKKKTHRRIWNVLLLVTFLVSGILGLILVLQINYKILSSYFLQFLQWHVDFGIGMAWISIFHIIWHFSYFKNIVRINRDAKE